MFSHCIAKHNSRYAGYCNSVVGSIVANKGFIQAFGTVHDPKTGKLVLDAHHVSIWAAVNYASQITFQFISPFTADRFGRKFNMWVFTFFLTLVSLQPLRKAQETDS